MAFLVSTSAGGGAGGTSPNIDTTGATFLIANGVADSGVPTISDSKGNTWTAVPTIYGGSFPTFHRQRLFYVENPTVGTGHNFTCSGTNASACFAAHDAVAVSSVYDTEIGAQRLGVSAATGGSIGAASRLVITGLGAESAAVSATLSTAGFTLDEAHPHVGGISYGSYIGHKYVSAAEDPSWSLGGTFDVTVANASFVTTGGGGGGPVTPYPVIGDGVGVARFDPGRVVAFLGACVLPRRWGYTLPARVPAVSF